MNINELVLPDFFKDVEIIGSAHLELPKYQKLHKNIARNDSPESGVVSANATPILMTNEEVKKIYINNDFKKIKNLEKKAQKDLEAIHSNISTNGPKAWTKVRKDGKEFYMSFSNTGTMWAYTESIVSKNDTTYQSTVQVGTYTASGKILGIHSYNLDTTTFLTESALAYIIARAVSQVVAEGLGFVVARFGMFLAEAAAELGLESFSFAVSTAAISTVATCLVFVVVFIGLVALWNFLNRKYTIRLQIFNWDEENSWKIKGEYLSNAKYCGDDNSKESTNIILPKMVAPSEIITPPGFDPVESLDSICYYGIIIWENDNTFMEGCSMALGIEKGESNQGFMWAFECPRWSNNNQAANDCLEDPKKYRNNVKWNKKPLEFGIESTNSKIPISFALDALKGADDDLYNINIHINKN